MPHPGPFQITAFAWVVECVIFYVNPLRVECISYSHLTLLEVSHTGLQSQTFWRFTFLVQDSQAGEPNMELGLLAYWGEPLQL